MPIRTDVRVVLRRNKFSKLGLWVRSDPWLFWDAADCFGDETDGRDK